MSKAPSVDRKKMKNLLVARREELLTLIDVGEETGSLDSMLNKVADIYDNEVEVAVEGMLSLMEPAIILILGGIIGFIVI